MYPLPQFLLQTFLLISERIALLFSSYLITALRQTLAKHILWFALVQINALLM